MPPPGLTPLFRTRLRRVPSKDQAIMADFTAPAHSLGIAGGRSVIAVLGPTNTGKTHLAIERMLGHESGLIGLPLRLLAREVYDKIVAKIGPARVALIAGEERIIPENPRYYVS